MAYEDLEDYSEKVKDTDFFNVIIPDLDPGTNIPVQFRWQYSDKSFGGWSAGKILVVPQLERDEATDIVAIWEGTNLKITWNAPALSTNFTIYLTSGATTVPYGHLLDKSKTSQSLVLSAQTLMSNFAGILPTSLTGLLKTVYIDTSTTGQAFVIPDYIDSVCTLTPLNSDWEMKSISNGITVSWSGIIIAQPTYLYTEVHVQEPAGSYELKYSGKGPAIITLTTLAEVNVKIKHNSISGCVGFFSNVKTAKAYDPIVFDSEPPVNTFTLGSATVTDDSNGLFSFDKKVLFTWTENASSDTAGYRIRFRIAGTADPYTYMSVPGKEKLSTYLYGLKGGKTYEIGVSTFDTYGNTNETQWSTYPNIVAPASTSLLPDVAITAGNMKLGYGIGGDNANRGLYLGPENYWYVQGNTEVSSAARVSIGGTGDKLIWNGTTLTASGTINANAGTFTSSIDVGSAGAAGQLRVYSSGGTIEMGSMVGKSGTGITYAGQGIQITRADGKYVQLDTVNGIIANAGTIAGWVIGTETLVGGSLTLNKSGAITTANGKFGVTSGGILTASEVDITGVLNATSGKIGTIGAGWIISGDTITSYGTSGSGSPVILNSQTGTISGGLISGTKIVGSAFFIGANEYADNYIKSDGTFRLGGGQLAGTSSSVTISGASLVLQELGDGEDGTAGDPTVVRIINPAALGGVPDGKIVTGRAIWYGGNNIPTSAITSRYAYWFNHGGVQGFINGVQRYTAANPGAFVTGDLYMTTV